MQPGLGESLDTAWLHNDAALYSRERHRASRIDAQAKERRLGLPACRRTAQAGRDRNAGGGGAMRGWGRRLSTHEVNRAKPTASPNASNRAPVGTSSDWAIDDNVRHLKDDFLALRCGKKVFLGPENASGRRVHPAHEHKSPKRAVVPVGILGAHWLGGRLEDARLLVVREFVNPLQNRVARRRSDGVRQPRHQIDIKRLGHHRIRDVRRDVLNHAAINPRAVQRQHRLGAMRVECWAGAARKDDEREDEARPKQRLAQVNCVSARALGNVVLPVYHDWAFRRRAPTLKLLFWSNRQSGPCSCSRTHAVIERKMPCMNRGNGRPGERESLPRVPQLQRKLFSAPLSGSLRTLHGQLGVVAVWISEGTVGRRRLLC